MINASRLKFYPLTFVADTFDITVGRPDIESYAVFPPDGVALLQQMQAGLSPAQASKWYEQQYGEPIDINDFLDTLRELHFIRTDEEAEEIQATPSPVSWQWLGRAAFSLPAWILYVVVFGFCIYTIVRVPQLLPTYRNLFFSPYYTVIELGLFFGQFPGIFFHELYHVLAGRRLGVTSRLGLGRRLYFVVFQTSLSGLWSVPRRSRYLPFLAGMLADVLWFSFLTLVAWITMTPGGRLSPIGAFCLALAFTTALRFLWQFYFYLQTDLYYVFTNAFECVDLQRTTQHYLSNLLFRLLNRKEKLKDEALWHPRDRQIAAWYAPFYVLGCLLTIGVFLSVMLPAASRVLLGVFTHLFRGSAINANSFWDSFIFLTLNILQLVVAAFIFLRERRKSVPQPIKEDTVSLSPALHEKGY